MCRFSAEHTFEVEKQAKTKLKIKRAAFLPLSLSVHLHMLMDNNGEDRPPPPAHICLWKKSIRGFDNVLQVTLRKRDCEIESLCRCNTTHILSLEFDF